MTLASDISTAVSTASTAIDSVATQVALLQSYKTTNGGGTFNAAAGFAQIKALREAWAKLQPALENLIVGN